MVVEQNAFENLLVDRLTLQRLMDTNGGFAAFGLWESLGCTLGPAELQQN